MRNIIFITGKAASGKSTLAKKFEKEGYFLISLDKIVTDIIIPEFKNEVEENWTLFKIYRDGDFGNTIDKARELFTTTVKELIEKHIKVVVEGSLTNNKLIRNLFTDFTFLFVKPKNEKVYTERLKERFIQDPTNYGRVGFIKNNDKDGLALTDYHNNGIEGPIIKQLLEEIGKSAYKDVEKLCDWYRKDFIVEVYEN